MRVALTMSHHTSMQVCCMREITCSTRAIPRCKQEPMTGAITSHLCFCTRLCTLEMLALKPHQGPTQKWIFRHSLVLSLSAIARMARTGVSWPHMNCCHAGPSPCFRIPLTYKSSRDLASDNLSDMHSDTCLSMTSSDAFRGPMSRCKVQTMAGKSYHICARSCLDPMTECQDW